ncbi:MAG: hypothetical protein NZZ41_03525 [Candidatus Dojkabacteria bacterium]|nr:hypothetical protein [Candidatus Dojkabacteria bacterium]
MSSFGYTLSVMKRDVKILWLNGTVPSVGSMSAVNKGLAGKGLAGFVLDWGWSLFMSKKDLAEV